MIFRRSYTSFSDSLNKLIKIVRQGENQEPVAITDFDSLEKEMLAVVQEANQRFADIREENKCKEDILDGMCEAVFAMDNQLKLHLINQKAKELFKLTGIDVTTKTLLEVTRCTELVEIAKNVLTEGSHLEEEITMHAGIERHFRIFASPLGNNDGVVLALQEITQLVKLETVRKDFVANVSHELRTPIQLIKGFSETLAENIFLENQNALKENKRFIEIIIKNAETMENLTNDLLILADLEDNNVDTRDMEECNIADLIDEAVSSLELQFKKNKIEIKVKCQKDLTVMLHGSLIIQALINLIENGIKYSPKKSKITVSGSIEGSEVIFEVRDKGIGIPADHLKRIFERFYRVDKSRSRRAGGTGLGLSIVRHIALLHGGTAEAESHADEGSVFRIKIPVRYHH